MLAGQNHALTLDRGELEMLWFRLFVVRHIKDSKETKPAQRRPRGRVWW